jgi:hypothetical protein
MYALAQARGHSLIHRFVSNNRPEVEEAAKQRQWQYKKQTRREVFLAVEGRDAMTALWLQAA